MKNYPDSLERKRFTYKGDKQFKTNGENYRNFDRLNSRKFEITKEKLEELINDRKIFSGIGEIFGVSDNAVKKRAKKLGISK